MSLLSTVSDESMGKRKWPADPDGAHKKRWETFGFTPSGQQVSFGSFRGSQPSLPPSGAAAPPPCRASPVVHVLQASCSLEFVCTNDMQGALPGGAVCPQRQQLQEPPPPERVSCPICFKAWFLHQQPC